MESKLSHIVVTRSLGGAVAMVTISFQNREGYVRSAIRISVTCHARKLIVTMATAPPNDLVTTICDNLLSITARQRDEIVNNGWA